MRRSLVLAPLLLATGVGLAADAPKTEPQPPSKDDANLGMSILGNQEAPKSLVIVPWKSSELGDAIGISTQLDDSKLPVDRDVFLRALRYYEIKTEMTPHGGARPGGRATTAAESNVPQPVAAARRSQ